MAKQVLIDLYMLKYPHCGFGQIAWNLARYFRDEYRPDGEIGYTLLVPPRYAGRFGNQVHYEKGTWLKRYFPCMAGVTTFGTVRTKFPVFAP